jgi:hypothetical protein
LRHKRRGEPIPEVKEETAKTPPRRAAVDVSKLKFRSTVSDEEMKRESEKYDSELWKDL